MKLELGKTYETISCHKVKIISLQHERCTGSDHQVAFGQMAECGSISMWQLDGTPIRTIGIERNHVIYNLKNLVREDVKGEEMKFEEGKFYKQRNGGKVLICKVNAGGAFCIHGFCYNSENIETWRTNGMARSNDEDIGDLVGEWVEPKKRLGRIAYQCTVQGLMGFVSGIIHFAPANAEMNPDHWRRLPWLDEPKEI